MFYFPQVVLTSGQSPTPTKAALKHSPFQRDEALTVRLKARF
jgi:hypothetical protein